MQLKNNWHLAYCTNIHPGDDWPQTLASLETHTLAVREQICPDQPYAMGLRLSDLASRQLSMPDTLDAFRKWLQEHQCYVFTINGFPFGSFHGGKVKEQVYRPDWTHPERLAYTNRLFDILAQLLPKGIEGTVSTLPGSFKEFDLSEEQEKQIRRNLWECIDHIGHCSSRYGRRLSLALEPEPLCLWENSDEIVLLFQEMEADRPGDQRLHPLLGVNYDACHLALEYEEPAEVIRKWQKAGIRINKIHLSSALEIHPTKAARDWLQQFTDDTYLHQVIARTTDGTLRRYKDLPQALEQSSDDPEWRVHFHVPLYAENLSHGKTTTPHLLHLLDILASEPRLCSHFEIETYTWDVLPKELRARTVDEQLIKEYGWCLNQLTQRGIPRIGI